MRAGLRAAFRWARCVAAETDTPISKLRALLVTIGLRRARRKKDAGGTRWVEEYGKGQKNKGVKGAAREVREKGGRREGGGKEEGGMSGPDVSWDTILGWRR
eukprot:3819513-Rhodomonas_salina.1